MARRSLRRVTNFATARARARKVLPKVLFDFIDGGADDEITLRENEAAFGRVTFRPRNATSIVSPPLATTVLGTQVSMPLLLAPCGGSRLVYRDGERALVRAANAAGTIGVMSNASSTAVEDVAAATDGPAWFQLYFPGTREHAASIVERVAEAGFGALFVTIDVPIRGNQERVGSRHHLVPPPPTLTNAIRFASQLALRPRWTYGYLRDGFPSRAISPTTIPEGVSNVWTGTRSSRPNVTWEDLAWIRDRWHGPYVVKGVLTREDARRAVECGATGVVVSNHGGRQLDGAPAALRALPEVRDEVGDDVDVLIDGGIRRGSDVIKAVALGANAAMIGRPYLYGLAIAGEAGVAHVLELFRDDLIRTFRLLGWNGTAELDASAVVLDRLDVPGYSGSSGHGPGWSGPEGRERRHSQYGRT